MLISSLAMAQPSSATANDKVPDFRDIKWGEHVDSVFKDGEKVNFVKVDDAMNENSYKIPGDDMTIGTVKLQKINYIFNEDNRFKKVFIRGEPKHLADMEFILNYKFGEPTNQQSLGYVNLKTWKVGNVVFTLSDFKDEKTFFTLTIESKWENEAAHKRNINVDDF